MILKLKKINILKQKLFLNENFQNVTENKICFCFIKNKLAENEKYFTLKILTQGKEITNELTKSIIVNLFYFITLNSICLQQINF
jgi:hypothetical protein